MRGAHDPLSGKHVVPPPLRHQVTFRANEDTETVYCEFDGNHVCAQSIAMDSYGAAVRDASRCIPLMLEAFRDTYG